MTTLIFAAKYYLVGPKITLMVRHSIFLQVITHYSFPLNNHLTEPVSFHSGCTPCMAKKVNSMPTLSYTGDCPILCELYN